MNTKPKRAQREGLPERIEEPVPGAVNPLWGANAANELFAVMNAIIGLRAEPPLYLLKADAGYLLEYRQPDPILFNHGTDPPSQTR